MTRRFEIRPETDGTSTIRADRKTIELIGAALDIINPDDPSVAQWAEDLGFTIATHLEVFPPNER